jgi:large subunit ribosomal protein LP2
LGTNKHISIVFFNLHYISIKMQEVAAYLLLVLGGKDTPSADDIKSVLAAAGNEEPSDDSINALVGDMEGKSVNDLLAAGMEKLKDVPMGGGGGGGGGSGGGDAAEEAVEEEKPEEEEVGDAPVVDMFGADGDGDY